MSLTVTQRFAETNFALWTTAHDSMMVVGVKTTHIRVERHTRALVDMRATVSSSRTSKTQAGGATKLQLGSMQDWLVEDKALPIFFLLII